MLGIFVRSPPLGLITFWRNSAIAAAKSVFPPVYGIVVGLMLDIKATEFVAYVSKFHIVLAVSLKLTTPM